MLRFPRFWWGLGFAGVLAAIVMSLIPDPPSFPGDSEGWVAHVVAYGTMMAWFARLEGSLRRRTAWALGLCAMGIGIEFVQGWTGRTYDEADMIANAVGVLMGWLASPPRVPHGIAAADRWLARRFP